MYETPILLIIFNRPDTTRQVFEAIRQQKPKYLFVAADGPRPDNTEDLKNCQAARDVIQVDWECDLKTLYRNQNRGCGHGPAEAITWFFEHVEAGIILEDDCLPSHIFFDYCEKLLKYYKTDNRIFVISGTNPSIKWKANKNPYIIAKLGGTWGWATWKRAWDKFDHSMSKWQTIEGKDKIKKFLGNKCYYDVFSKEFDEFSNEIRRKDVWDHQWLFARLVNESYSIVPTSNLISNIGFGIEAHHTTNVNDKLSKLPFDESLNEIKIQLFKPDKLYDWVTFERFINPHKRSLLKKIALKAIKTMFT